MNDNSQEGQLARIERPALNAMAVQRGGSMVLNTMADVIRASELMARARQGVPKHLREEPGLCFSVIMQAIAWEMDIFAVARQSFVINDFVSYGSQLIHAVIETRAPLRKRLRCTYAGEGPERTCTVLGMFVGEDEPHKYTTPRLKDIPIKNSPLWKWDVDQQLFYLASRAWARKWCPDVLLGVYSPDEAQFAGENAIPAQPIIHNPLQDDADLEPARQVREDAPYTEQEIERSQRNIKAVFDAAGMDIEAETETEVMPSDQRPNEISPETSPPCATGGGPATLTNPDPSPEELAAEPPRQARRKPAGEPKSEAAPKQAAPEKASPAPNPALGIALEQPWIKRTVADYITYLEKWTDAWGAWGQDPNGLRDRFSAERTIRNGLGEKFTDKQLAQCKATASGAFARLGGVVPK